MADLASAAPRPNSRALVSVGWNGSVSQLARSPGGWTSWCAYSRTVGAPGGAGRRATTAGWPFGTDRTSTSRRPADASSVATSSALRRRWGAAAGPADTDGIRTRRSRSARTDGKTCWTAWSRVMLRRYLRKRRGRGGRASGGGEAEAGGGAGGPGGGLGEARVPGQGPAGGAQGGAPCAAAR